MKKLWIATGNPDKAKEMRLLIARFFPEVHEVCTGEANGVVESAVTFLGNAQIKSRALASQLLSDIDESEFGVLADDSGLCIDALGGKPGVFSARFAGPKATSAQNIAKVYDELAKVDEEKRFRAARFHCALCLVVVSQKKISKEICAEGTHEGFIAEVPMGESGFGYDSIFVDGKSKQTFAQLSFEEKQNDSHRTRAFESLKRLVE